MFYHIFKQIISCLPLAEGSNIKRPTAVTGISITAYFLSVSDPFYSLPLPKIDLSLRSGKVLIDFNHQGNNIWAYFVIKSFEHRLVVFFIELFSVFRKNIIMVKVIQNRIPNFFQNPLVA